MTPPPTAPAAPGRHRAPRRRVTLVLAGVAVLVAALVGWTIAREDASGSAPAGSPALDLTARAGEVVVTGAGFPPAATVRLSARTAGGGGSAWTTTGEDGGFDLVLRPPDGFTGEVAVSASSGDVRQEQALDVPAGAAPATGPDGVGTDDAAGVPLVVPLTGAPAEPPERAPTGLPRFDVPEEIAADCSVDVTDELNRWLAGVPDGSELRFARDGCYRVDGSLRLEERSDLVVSGAGATFRATTRVPTRTTERAQWRLDLGAGITLRDMTLVGVNPEVRFDEDQEFDHNLFIRGTSDVLIENVHGRNAHGDFISVAHGADGETIPTGITIRDVSADTIGRMGIACVACDRMSVTGSVLNGVALHAFDLEIEGDGRPGREVTFSGNTVEEHGWAAVSVGTPFQTFDNDLSDVEITDNLVTQPGTATDECLPAISFRDSKIPAEGVLIAGNSLRSRTDAILVRLASDVTVRDNTATRLGPSCGDPVGLRTESVEGMDVGGNEFSGYRAAQVTE
ncbi:right-handed parallel beta-helix repeat-containing protein [Modestobacter italicus]|uniref:right-handed parallel beta-helix repeat-containing protein n=1 Tax=Modestobacter italicus (strain DSM 44449 / CECT 9708 / BC 501) TaxID=2732864 RepID=UPI001C98BACB|nr:hypothetical protein [Modestobacter italicus]